MSGTKLSAIERKGRGPPFESKRSKRVRERKCSWLSRRALALLVDGDNGGSKSVSLAMMCRDGIDSGHVSAKLMSQAFNYRIECTIGR